MNHDIRYQIDLRYGAMITIGIDDNDSPAYTIHFNGNYAESGNFESAKDMRHVFCFCYRLMNRKITYKTRQFIRNASNDVSE